jgi:general secretion pathway protein M
VTALPTGRRGQALALAIGVLALVATLVLVVEPLRAAYRGLEEELATSRTQTERLRANAEQLPILRAERDRLRQQAGTEGMLLPGASDSVASVALQAKLRQLAADGGAELASSEVLAAEPRGEFRRIALRVTLTATLPSLVSILSGVEAAEPAMFADNIQIRTAAAPARAGQGEMLAVSMEVHGFRTP